jgi:protein phosphatase
VHGTSLTNARSGAASRPAVGDRVSLVADGVGGQLEARRPAAGGEAVTTYVSSSLRCYHAAGATDDKLFLDGLRAAAMNAHETVSVESAIRGDTHMATTLTFGIAVWPWLYVLQVGDSRAYFCCNGVMRQITRDQTVAQDLVDQGVLTPERAANSPYTHVLSSAIGGSAALPVVTRIDVRGERPVVLLCSDGSTKHITDREIEQHILGLDRPEQLCRALLELALERGGSDNITIVVGRVRTSTRCVIACGQESGGMGSGASPFRSRDQFSCNSSRWSSLHSVMSRRARVGKRPVTTPSWIVTLT